MAIYHSSRRAPTIRRIDGRKSQNQGAEGAGRDNRLQVSDDLASESQYGCRARMASRRDQENWQEDRLMIFLRIALRSVASSSESPASGSNSQLNAVGRGLSRSPSHQHLAKAWQRSPVVWVHEVTHRRKVLDQADAGREAARVIGCKQLIIKGLVEAAGVEPASEIVVSRETPCVVAFQRLRNVRLERTRCARH